MLRIYYDDTDAALDGLGWNVVNKHGAFAFRFRKRRHALLFWLRVRGWHD